MSLQDLHLEDRLSCVMPLNSSQMFIAGWSWAGGVITGLILIAMVFRKQLKKNPGDSEPEKLPLEVIGELSLLETSDLVARIRAKGIRQK